jgi:hypothetical protein
MYNIFFSPEICAVYGVMWKKVRAREVTDDNITRRMRLACRIVINTDTH